MKLALWKGQDFFHAKQNIRNLKRSQETELQERRENFYFCFLYFPFCRNVAVKERKRIFVFTSLPLELALVKSSQTISNTCTALVKVTRTQAYPKQDKQFQKNTNSVMKIDYTIILEPCGFPRMSQMVYAKCWWFQVFTICL